MAAKKMSKRTVQLGDLVVEAFDLAARYSDDPQKVSRLATLAVMQMLSTQSRAPRERKAPLAHSEKPTARAARYPLSKGPKVARAAA